MERTFFAVSKKASIRVSKRDDAIGLVTLEELLLGCTMQNLNSGRLAYAVRGLEDGVNEEYAFAVEQWFDTKRADRRAMGAMDTKAEVMAIANVRKTP